MHNILELAGKIKILAKKWMGSYWISLENK
jgi:hypothetical protein